MRGQIKKKKGYFIESLKTDKFILQEIQENECNARNLVLEIDGHQMNRLLFFFCKLETSTKANKQITFQALSEVSFQGMPIKHVNQPTPMRKHIH